jgi:hypothetical protein
MHIQAFYRKFTSKSEQGNLFEGLRSLSRIDDFKSMFSEGNDGLLIEWQPWPPSGVDAPCEA